MHALMAVPRSEDRKATQATISSPAGKVSKGRIVYISAAPPAISS